MKVCAFFPRLRTMKRLAVPRSPAFGLTVIPVSRSVTLTSMISVGSVVVGRAAPWAAGKSTASEASRPRVRKRAVTRR